MNRHFTGTVYDTLCKSITYIKPARLPYIVGLCTCIYIAAHNQVQCSLNLDQILTIKSCIFHIYIMYYGTTENQNWTMGRPPKH